MLCPECGTHVEEIVAVPGPCGTRYCIPCPEILRAEVEPAARKQWALDFEQLAALLAQGLNLTGKTTELVASRLWRLGRTQWQGQSRDVVLARGLHWDDGAVPRSRLVRCRKPIVFVPAHVPPTDFWRTTPVVLALSHVVSLVDGRVGLDPIELATAIHDVDSVNATGGEITVTKEGLKQMIRTQMKAEAKSTLADDILLAAYRQCGSLREAAAFLTRETDREVSKDQVHRAVLRAGGVKEVMETDDSASVARSAPSRRRDRVQKTDSYGK